VGKGTVDAPRGLNGELEHHGHRVNFTSFAEDIEATPLFKGLPTNGHSSKIDLRGT